MSYAVKEIFYTLQGEGAHTGRPAVFCRFAGCNLWSGHERDRATAICRFCDTDFVGTDGEGGGKFATAGELAAAVAAAWPGGAAAARAARVAARAAAVRAAGASAQAAGQAADPAVRAAEATARAVGRSTRAIDPTARAVDPAARAAREAPGAAAPLASGSLSEGGAPSGGGVLSGGGALPGSDRLSGGGVLSWSVAAVEVGARVRPFVVCTGGEPLLQLDAPLVAALHEAGFEVAIETNGTRLPPPGIDWICVSPKAGAELVLTAGDELKLVFPQPGAEPERFEHLAFRHFFLQPMDGPERERNTQLALRYCLEHPQWRLSLQAHKLLGIP